MLTSLALRWPRDRGPVTGEEGYEVSMKTPPWDWTTSAIEPKQEITLDSDTFNRARTDHGGALQYDRSQDGSEGPGQKYTRFEGFVSFHGDNFLTHKCSFIVFHTALKHQKCTFSFVEASQVYFERDCEGNNTEPHIDRYMLSTDSCSNLSPVSFVLT